MKVLIFIFTMSRGGAARVTSSLCQEMTKNGYQVHLATNIETNPIFYEVPDSVVTHQYYAQKQDSGLLNSLKMNFAYCRLARQIIKRVSPDVIIAVEPRMFLYAKLGNIGLGIPIIASEHTTFDIKHDVIKHNVLINFIRHRLYGTANALTILTKKDYNLLGRKFPNKTVIYNPLSFPVLDYPTNRKKNILCAGRLDAWKIKGFDTILDCWQRIASEYPDWVLEIAGDGTVESTDFLRTTINNKGLSDRVVLLGQVDNMQEKLSQTAIFALPSRVEGFPMVLMEAMSQGCACVAYEVSGAVYEMINNGEDGIIVPDSDVDSFVEGLSRLIESAELRDKISKNALASVQRFSPSSFMKSWDDLIKRVVNKK